MWTRRVKVDTYLLLTKVREGYERGGFIYLTMSRGDYEERTMATEEKETRAGCGVGAPRIVTKTRRATSKTGSGFLLRRRED